MKFTISLKNESGNGSIEKAFFFGLVLEWSGEDVQVLERKNYSSAQELTCSGLGLDVLRGNLPKLRQKDLPMMGDTEMSQKKEEIDKTSSAAVLNWALNG